MILLFYAFSGICEVIFQIRVVALACGFYIPIIQTLFGRMGFRRQSLKQQQGFEIAFHTSLSIHRIEAQTMVWIVIMYA